MTFIEIVRLREINLNKNKENAQNHALFFFTNIVEFNLAHIRSLIKKIPLMLKLHFNHVRYTHKKIMHNKQTFSLIYNLISTDI